MPHDQPAQGSRAGRQRPRHVGGRLAKQGGGFYSFENGHLLLWTNWANPEDRLTGTAVTN